MMSARSPQLRRQQFIAHHDPLPNLPSFESLFNHPTWPARSIFGLTARRSHDIVARLTGHWVSDCRAR
jgi:hypothetical protein